MYSGISFSQQGALLGCFGEVKLPVPDWNEANPVVEDAKDEDQGR